MSLALLQSLMRLIVASYLAINLWLAFRKGWTTGLWKMRVERVREPKTFWFTVSVYALTLALMAVALLARHGF